MSKLIVEMEMPSSCFGCPISIIYGKEMICRLDNARRKCDFDFRPDWCPICGELPDEHGDLIDRSLLCADLAGVILSHSGLGVVEVIARQDAVIAAERSEHGTTVD